MPKRKRGFVASSSRSNRPPSPRAYKDEQEEDPVAVWVQCEHESCQKWRRISAEEAEDLKDSPWYCWLNRDVRFNTCSASEEKAKKPKHMKFIYSLLPLGEVVMAKMSGYPVWPGLLTQDPTCGEYYDAPLDKENEITHYHVEFFGQPRSRAWLVPALVHPLRSTSETEKVPQFRKIQGRQLTELKRSYEAALKEAHSSLNMTVCERLESCHFKYVEEKDAPLISEDQVNESKIKQGVKREALSISPTIPVITNKPLDVNNRSESMPFWKENDFLDSLESFSVEQGMAVPKQPVWRGKRISLFQFYNLVLRYGGFENVCRCKLWNKVYNELLESNVIYGGMSTAARVFYQKNLMPFEHHITSRTKVGIQFVPDDFSSNPAKRPGCERRRNSSSSGSREGEQTVPQDSTTSEHTNQQDIKSDLIPSSNPDSPRRCSLGSCSFDSDDDESTTFSCDMVEQELQQLERLLSSLEPSLYPQTDGDGDECVKARCQKDPLRSVSRPDTTIRPAKEVDVIKTLDEMARIEGAIADLNSLVSLELDNL